MAEDNRSDSGSTRRRSSRLLTKVLSSEDQQFPTLTHADFVVFEKVLNETNQSNTKVGRKHSRNASFNAKSQLPRHQSESDFTSALDQESSVNSQSILPASFSKLTTGKILTNKDQEPDNILSVIDGTENAAAAAGSPNRSDPTSPAEFEVLDDLEVVCDQPLPNAPASGSYTIRSSRSSSSSANTLNRHDENQLSMLRIRNPANDTASARGPRNPRLTSNKMPSKERALFITLPQDNIVEHLTSLSSRIRPSVKQIDVGHESFSEPIVITGRSIGSISPSLPPISMSPPPPTDVRSLQVGCGHVKYTDLNQQAKPNRISSQSGSSNSTRAGGTVRGELLQIFITPWKYNFDSC